MRWQLAVVLILLAAAVAYAYITWPRQQRVEPAPLAARPTSRGAREGLISEVGWALDFHDSTPLAPFASPQRDLFAMVLPPPPPPPPPPKVVSVPVKVAPPPPPVPTLPPITLLGALEKQGATLYFLSVNNQAYVVRSGESFGDGYRILKIEPNQLVIGRAGSPAETLVPLSQTP